MARMLAVLVALVTSDVGSASAQVTGTVRFDGPSPKTELLDYRTDPVCISLGGQAAADHTLVSESGGLANVFVHVIDPPLSAGGGENPKALPVLVLDQHKCRYHPKVFGIRIGQTLEIRNGDPTLHTTHAFTFRGFNVVTPRQGQRIQKTFTRAQVMVPIRCDVHPWMTAYAGVLPHPFFAVTDADGRFVLPTGLPDGDYVLEAWHEKLGRQRFEVKVAGGQSATEVVFRPKDPS